MFLYAAVSSVLNNQWSWLMVLLVVLLHIVGRLCKWRWWLSLFMDSSLYTSTHWWASHPPIMITVMTMTMDLLYTHIYIGWEAHIGCWSSGVELDSSQWSIDLWYFLLMSGWDIAHYSNCSKRGGMVCIILETRGGTKRLISLHSDLAT